MYCTYCGKEIPKSSKRCPNCGKLIANEYYKEQNASAELVKKAQGGDQAAISILYEQTYNQVYYTVKSMIKDEDAIFDILQDSYIKAFSHLGSFEGGDKFTAWVRQIAANTARDWMKKKRPMLFSELEQNSDLDLPAEEWFEDENTDHLPEYVIDQNETSRLIREILDELPEDQRAAIGMYYYEEMSVREIAASMNATENAVKSRLLYGRRKIEKKVRELEKKGTKLYGLAPIPFLLWLLRGQKAYAAELPNTSILQNVLKNVSHPATAPSDGGLHAAKTSAAHAAKTAGTAKVATAGAGLSATKITAAIIASVVVIGGGALGITKLSRHTEQAAKPVVSTNALEFVESYSSNENPSVSASSEAELTQEKDLYVERVDHGSGYTLFYYDGLGHVVRTSIYSFDDTLIVEHTYEYDNLGRVIEHFITQSLNDNKGNSERRITYHYTPGDTHVNIDWEETAEFIDDPGAYTASDHFSYDMQASDNEISMNPLSCFYDRETSSIILERLIVETDSGVEISRQYFTCSEDAMSDDTDSDNSADSNQTDDPLEEALEKYRNIIANAATYDFGEYAYPNGQYLYALEYMHTGDPVPTLLLCQLGDDYIDHVRIFYYDVDSQTILAPEEVITTGVAQTGGFRGGLSMMGDGNGLQIFESGGMRGDIYISRAIRSDNSLIITQEWSGFLDDNDPYRNSAREIKWYGLSDESGLTKTERDIETTDIATDSTPTEQDAATLWIAAEEAVGRTILTGTVDTITYDEAVELQGYPDYNAADKGQTWVIIRLDTPQVLKGMQDVSTWEKEHSVVLIWTKRSSGSEYGEDTLSEYLGEHVICSVGSFSKASDTSVPIGMPWGHDIHVLDE